MREVYDFSNAKIHCSSIYNVITQAQGKDYKGMHDRKLKELDEHEAMYYGWTPERRKLATGIKKAEKIEEVKREIEELVPLLDKIELSEGAKTHLKSVYADLKYNKRSVSRERGSKMTNKGKIVEVEAIKLISALDGIEYSKNESHFENDFIIGTPDCIATEPEIYVADVKSPWDMETFIGNLGEELDLRYWWQIQGYMWLTGAKKGEVSYCLINSPEEFITDEVYAMARQMNEISTDTPAMRLQEAIIRNNMTFDEIPMEERRIKFEVEYSQEAIDRIKEVIPLCRQHLMEIQELHLKNIFH